MIEMNRENIRIDPALDVDTNWNPPCVFAYIEIWFDADAKFGTHTRDRDDAWINLYALYSPVYHTLRMEYFIETDTSVSAPIAYEPTEAERKVIMKMIEEKCRETENCSCVELLLEAIHDDEG